MIRNVGLASKERVVETKKNNNQHLLSANYGLGILL